MICPVQGSAGGGANLRRRPTKSIAERDIVSSSLKAPNRSRMRCYSRFRLAGFLP